MDKLTKNETQALIDYVKGMVLDNKDPEEKAVIALCDELELINNLKPVAFTIKDDSGYLYLNRMTTQECDELNHQLNLLQEYCPLKQYSITPLYRLDK